jgi:hypothetical protein
MIDRWLWGRHPLDGSYGAWLSKPGINVRSTVDPDLMLISPSKKNEQILLSGMVVIGAGGTATVFYPENFSSIPFVQFYSSNSGDQITCPPPFYSANGGSMVYVNQFTNAATFTNSSNLTLAIFYAVAARAG